MMYEKSYRMLKLSNPSTKVEVYANIREKTVIFSENMIFFSHFIPILFFLLLLNSQKYLFLLFSILFYLNDSIILDAKYFSYIYNIRVQNLSVLCAQFIWTTFFCNLFEIENMSD